MNFALFFLLSIPVNTQSKLLARSHWGSQSPYASGDFCFPLLSQGAVIVSNPTTQLSKSFANLILKGKKKKKHSKAFKGKSKKKKKVLKKRKEASWWPALPKQMSQPV